MKHKYVLSCYRVIYHKTVFEYLETLERKSLEEKRAKVLLKSIRYHIELLKIRGTQLPMPYARHIEDFTWELRPANNRIFYAFYEKDTFVLLHYYCKKSQKTPKNEIGRAKRVLQELKGEK